LGVTGVLTATSLDISGDVDVDGTLETDALSIASVVVTSTAAELNLLDGVTSTTAELNILDGVTSTFTELNLLDGVTSTTAELNILDGVTATTAELNYVDGVTSAIQTQINDITTAPTFVSPLTVTGGTQSWTVTAAGVNLTFAYNGVNVLRVDSSGNLTALGNVNTNSGTIT